MTILGAPAIAPAEFPARTSKFGVTGTLLIDGLCGLSAGESSANCGRTWCSYFDGATGHCGLLDWDIPARLGPEALRWFVVHRTTKPIAEGPDGDEVLLARTCAF
jgi:hypothetical protein